MAETRNYYAIKDKLIAPHQRAVGKIELEVFEKNNDKIRRDKIFEDRKAEQKLKDDEMKRK